MYNYDMRPSVILTLVLLVSAAGNFFLYSRLTQIQTKSESTSQEFPYLSLRIFASNQNDLLINFVPLRGALREYDRQTKTPIGIYFEYLPSGTSIGINDTESFFGASLIKIPIVMKVYKLIEEEELTKDKKITIELQHIDKNFGSLWREGLGTTITLEEAVKLALTQSDNTAEKILREQIKDYPFSEVYDYIDIKPDTKITPKNYSSILRSLYLSAYLLRQDSNEILEIMTTSPFNDRIVAGVPKGVKVAHKIGIYKPGENGSEIHSDCGIVYLPNRPYILCVMAKASFDESTKIMGEISKMVYEYVSTVNPEEGKED